VFHKGQCTGHVPDLYLGGARAAGHRHVGTSDTIVIPSKQIPRWYHDSLRQKQQTDIVWTAPVHCRPDILYEVPYVTCLEQSLFTFKGRCAPWSESETSGMYLLVWEKHFMYSFCLRVKPHLTWLSECPFVSVKRDVPICLRATFQYEFSLSTYFVRHEIDAYSCIINATNKQTNKQTNTPSILVVTWRTVYIIIFRVCTTCSYVGSFHVS